MPASAGVVATIVASTATAQDAPALVASADWKPEGDALIASVWAGYLKTCGTSAFGSLDGRTVLQLDDVRFHVAPTNLKGPAISHGYQYQATAIASARRWRWALLSRSGRSHWSDWQEGQTLTVRFDQTGGERGRTIVEDAVLQFDLVRRSGTWTANVPLSPLNSDYLPIDPLKAVPDHDLPPCERLEG